MSSDKKNRPFGIIVWGATGYTGNLICEYLLSSAPENVKWGIAGRNKSKLESLIHELGKASPKAKDVEIMIGDVDDQASMDAITKQTRVILSAAGPYRLHGTPVVASCVRNGTDYCDITGEVNWIKKLIDAFGEDAKRNNSIIVNCCGFDCIPSDMGTFYTTSHVKKTYGVNCESVRGYIRKFSGGISGGTTATIASFVGDSSRERGLSNPNYLIPRGISKVKQPGDQMLLGYDKDLKEWIFPSPLAICDNRLVRYSQYVMGYPNGEFSFRICMSQKSFFLSLIFTTVLITAFLLLHFRLARWALTKLIPSGSGPKKSSFHKGGVEIAFLVKLEQTTKTGVPKMVKSRLSFKGDPGYFVSAKMVAESALCLATQRDELPAKEGGIHTPSSSMGTLLIDRLRTIGFQFDITETFF